MLNKHRLLSKWLLYKPALLRTQYVHLFGRCV